MTTTVEVGYDDVAEQKLEGLRKDLGPVQTELKTVEVSTE